MSFENKQFVFDTNILLHDPNAFLAFDNCKIILPLVVLEELDGFKSEKGDVAKNARTAVKLIESISALGNIADGITISQENFKYFSGLKSDFRAHVKVVIGSQATEKFKQDLNLSYADNKILATCMELQKESETCLVTRDINLRVKARSLNIQAVDYDICRVEDYDYKGWREEFVEPDIFKSLNLDNLSNHFELKNFKSNEFLVVKNSADHQKFRLFRYLSALDRFKEINKNNEFWGIRAKNFCQAMAMDLLLDDSVPLVFLTGPAGTGKTLLTLVAGLHKVMVEQIYGKMFVARPLVSLGSDIGFTPGDLHEKLFHWMHPIYDNLDFLFNKIEESGEYFSIPKNRNALSIPKNIKSKGSGRFFADEFSKFYDQKIHRNTATLQHRGLLNLEAITHMRGRSLPGQFMFIDEAQNLTAQELKTIITRAGEGTKIILAGDPYQIDSGFLDFYNNGLTTSSLKLRDEKLVGLIYMETTERSPLAKLASEKL